MGDGGCGSFAFLVKVKMSHLIFLGFSSFSCCFIMMILTLKAATILLVMCALVGICFRISSLDGATA